MPIVHERSFGCRLKNSIELERANPATDSVRILDSDVVARRTAPVGDFNLAPGSLDAGVHAQLIPTDLKIKNRLKARAIHPARGTRVPRPPATAHVRRHGVNVPRHHIGFDSVRVQILPNTLQFARRARLHSRHGVCAREYVATSERACRRVDNPPAGARLGRQSDCWYGLLGRLRVSNFLVRQKELSSSASRSRGEEPSTTEATEAEIGVLGVRAKISLHLEAEI